MCCKNDTELNSEEDLYREICGRADALGMDSLTENEQAFLERFICVECL